MATVGHTSRRVVMEWHRSTKWHQSMCQLNEKSSLTFFYLEINLEELIHPDNPTYLISFSFLYHVKYKNTDFCGALSHHCTGSLIWDAVHSVPAKFPRKFPLTSLALTVCLLYWWHVGSMHGVNICGSTCAEFYIFYRGHDTKICFDCMVKPAAGLLRTWH